MDVEAIGQDSSFRGRSRGAAKTSLQNGGHGTRVIPFHKPFRGASGNSEENGGSTTTPSKSHPPSAFNIWKAPSAATPSSIRQRRARIPPTFNLMVRLNEDVILSNTFNT